MKKLIGLICMIGALSVQGCGCGTVEPGNRGVVVEWGKVQEPALKEGFQTYCPFGCNLHEVSIRQKKADVDAPCFSSDLQNIDVKVSVLYRIPEDQVINIFRDFNGEPFDTLVAPRVNEAIKEVTASRSAEMIVKEREAIKLSALDALRKKVGKIITIEDLIINNVSLSAQLNSAIEAKMVQEQAAEKAKYFKQQAEMDAETAIVKAKGEAEASLTQARADAESIRIRGNALSQNPGVVQLQLIQKWDGVAPQIVGGGTSGISLLLPAATNASATKSAK